MKRDIAPDAIRAAAVFAVVGIHSLAPLSEQVGLIRALWLLQWWSIPALFITSGFLHASSRDGLSVAWLRRRGRRILIPYVVASAIYLAYWEVKRIGGAAIESFEAGRTVRTLLFGTAASHLWFLPVVFACGVLAWLVMRGWVDQRVMFALACTGSASFVVLSAWHIPDSQLLYVMYRSPLYWMTFYLLGIHLAAPTKLPSRTCAWLLAAAGVLLCLYAAFMSGAAAPDASVLGEALVWIGPAVLGFGIVEVSFRYAEYSLDNRTVATAIEFIAARSLGIYVIHYAFVDAWQSLIMRYVDLERALAASLVGWAVVYAMSLTVMWMLHSLSQWRMSASPFSSR